MRGIWVGFGVTALLVACSSSSDDAGDSCQIVGTYSVAETRKTGECPQAGSPDTATISQNGSGYAVELGGTTGACSADVVSACKIQGKCDIAVKDPVDPTKDTGTFQFSWTFDTSGLKGTMVLSIPPAAPAPAGCTSEYDAVGTRK